MRLLDTILVPIVVGPRSDAAVKTAESVAAAFNSKILFLHVVPQGIRTRACLTTVPFESYVVKNESRLC